MSNECPLSRPTFAAFVTAVATGCQWQEHERQNFLRMKDDDGRQGGAIRPKKSRQDECNLTPARQFQSLALSDSQWLTTFCQSSTLSLSLTYHNYSIEIRGRKFDKPQLVNGFGGGKFLHLWLTMICHQKLERASDSLCESNCIHPGDSFLACWHPPAWSLSFLWPSSLPP